MVNISAGQVKADDKLVRGALARIIHEGSTAAAHQGARHDSQLRPLASNLHE